MEPPGPSSINGGPYWMSFEQPDVINRISSGERAVRWMRREHQTIPRRSRSMKTQFPWNASGIPVSG